jgi:hypothetical protein
MHYVKFLRLDSEEYKKLRYKDNDTLYFVSDADEYLVELYLGNKLIAGDNGTSEGGVHLLSQLKDISLNELVDRDVLVYSGLYQQWINMPLD